MKINRAKNASRNIIFGLIFKFSQIIMPFIMRTIMIYYMGIAYAGLSNLFSSILQVLNLAELGIGAALTFSMYEPIAKNDEEKICALVNMYKVTFRIIGLIILIIGLCLLPFLPNLVSGEVPGGLNLYVLYLMNLGVTVLSYCLFAYKNSLIYAHQRNDIISKVMLGTSIVQYSLQIVSIVIFKNYYYYLISSIIYQILTNLVTAFLADKMYPKYKPKGKVDKETVTFIRKRVLGLITNKMGNTLLNSVDSIIISAYLGLTILASYQNYYFVITALVGIILVVYDACCAGIGNSLLTESIEKNYDDFRTLTFIISFLTIFCCSCMLCLYQPFITLWVGKKYLLDYSLIILLILYFFVYQIERIIGVYKDAAGIWYEDRYRPLASAILNLILSLVMVKFLGLNGVKLATIICMTLCSTPWLISTLYKYVFKGQSKSTYYMDLIKYFILGTINCGITFFIISFIKGDGILLFITRGIICSIISICINLIFFRNNIYLKKSYKLIKKMIKKSDKIEGCV